MRRLFSICISLAFVHPAVHAAAESETLTYQFVPDGSLPYEVSCGECSLIYLGVRADVAGTFTIEIDRAIGHGKLVSLDDELVNKHAVLWSPTGPVLQPTDEYDSRIIPSRSWIERPPFDGDIRIVNGELILESNGFSLEPSGNYSTIGLPFEISVAENRASFSMTVPIDDWFITVNRVPAVLLVPEPNAISTIAICVAFFATLQGCRNR